MVKGQTGGVLANRIVRPTSQEMSMEYPEVSIGTEVVPERNVRKWFQSLASGPDRCTAMAIVDEAFNETFISLAWSGAVRGNKSRKPNHDYSGITRSVALDDLIQKYRQVQQNGVESHRATPPEDTALRIESPSGNASHSIADNIPRGTNTLTDSRLEKKAVETNTVSASKANVTDEKPDTKYITLYFKSGLALPIRSSAGNSTEKSSSHQSTETCASSNLNDRVKVDDKLNFSLLNSTHSTIDPATEKRKKAHALVVESKHAASSAISNISRRVVNDEEVIADHICLVFSPALNHVVHGHLDKSNDSINISYVTMNPTILDVQDGNQIRFLQLIDKVIRSTLDQRYGPEKNDAVHFLREDSSVGTNSFNWPHWLALCMDPGHTSVKLLLVLLARMEIAIREAHRRYLVTCRKENNPDNLDLENNSTMIPITDKERDLDTIIMIHQNALVPLRQLLSRSSSLDGDIHKIRMEMFNNLLRLWRRLQTKKSYSTILLDTIPAHSHEVLHPGLSPFRLEDVLLVPFSLVSEFAIVCAEMKEKPGPKNFITEMSTQWKNMYLNSLDSLLVFKHFPTQNDGVDNSAEPTNEPFEAFYDVCKNTEDDTSQLHEDSKSKKKKKKKKKKKNCNPNTNDKCAIDTHDEGHSDHSKEGSAHDIHECSTIDRIDVPSKSCHQETTSSMQLANSTKTDITVSKLSGSNSTCVVGAGRVETEDDGDVWETVEHKSARGSGKNRKDSVATQTVHVSSINIINNDVPPAALVATSPSGRSKSGKGRKKNSRRHSIKQTAKEIITNLIQSAEEEILLRKESTEKSTVVDRKGSAWGMEQSFDTSTAIDKVRAAPPIDSSAVPNSRKAALVPNLSASTFADIARLSLRNHENSSVVSQAKDHAASQGVNRVISGRESDKLKLQKCTTSSSADHNTAQTCPETVSGVSGTSNSSFTQIETYQKQKASEETNIEGSGILSSVPQTDSPATCETVRNDLFDSSDEGEPNFSTHTDSSGEAPPLQTLLGPGITNSATSSVASSLEVPHAIRRSRYCNASTSKEDDVGYHLLKVCEKLSVEMNTFMIRRASALTQRRQERAALLAALQDIAQNIWTGSSCHVEMYGSCATQLDLPSSDLDVVVCGLDLEMENRTMPTRNGHKSHKIRQARFIQTEDEPSTSSSNEFFTIGHPHAAPQSVNDTSYQQFYPSLSSSGMRVLRLAADLERQPWAVQVKAIPTASVPVVKVLADPSRLPGAIAANGEWLIHQQNITTASAVAAGGMIPRHQQHFESANFAAGDSEFSPPRHSSNGLQTKYQKTQPPWRGADVMNGLISVDITFEGPEHGGIGSTTFSARVVQEACTETGLPPDRTPAVQLIMVLKEMLAQRRLNEPFSGGLSSYAILLLAVAVIKERRAIREELERVERQRRSVAMESSGRQCYPKSDRREISKSQRAKKKLDSQEIRKDDIRFSLSNLTEDEKKSMESSDDICEKGSPLSLATARSSKFDTDVTLSAEAKSMDNNGNVETETIRSPLFPQGSNDVLEVLCSGEPTAGKLLMHFLLFYGHHFDAQVTCIDLLGTHHSEYSKTLGLHDDNGPTFLRSFHLSPFLQRRAGGVYDPVTGIYTVDQIVVYDPLEGAESNNVARSCFAWSTIRWVFEQCYNTLSGLVERDNNSVNGKLRGDQILNEPRINTNDVDDMPHLLELLLSF